MALRTLLKFRNLDTTRDINDRNVGLISPGIISGGMVTAVPGQLAVDVSPFKIISLDGMVVEETSETSRFYVLAGQVSVIAIKAVYRENNTPIVELVASPVSAFLALPDFEYFIICAYVNVPSGQTQVLQSYVGDNPPIGAPIAARPRDEVDPQGRQQFRGVLSNASFLPASDNRLGDFYLVQDSARGVLNFYGWDGAIWKNMTDAATLAADLVSHRDNLFPNEKHLTDDEKNAVVGTSGVPLSASNKLVDNSDTRIPTQNQTNAMLGNPENPSAFNRYITEEYTLATPSTYTIPAQLTTYIELPLLSSIYYGPFYVGELSAAQAIGYFKLYSTTLNREYVNSDGTAVTITGIYKTISPLVELNPSVDADSYGYYSGSLYLKTSQIVDTSCTVRYGQKAIFKTTPVSGNGVTFPADIFLRVPPSDAQISSDVIEKVQAIKGTLWDTAVPASETNRALRRSVIEGVEWAGSNFSTNTVAVDLTSLPENEDFYTLFENMTWARASGLVTVTSTNHGLMTGDTIRVRTSGGSPDAVSSGNKRITVTSSSVFYFYDAGNNAASTLTYSVQDFYKNTGIVYTYNFSNSAHYTYTYTYDKSTNTGSVVYSGLTVLEFASASAAVQIGNVFIDGSGSEFKITALNSLGFGITQRGGSAPLSIDTTPGGLSGYVKKDANPREINLSDFRLVAGIERVLFNKTKRAAGEINPFDASPAYEIEYPLVQEAGEPRIRFYGGIVTSQLSSLESAVCTTSASKLSCTAAATRMRLMYRSVQPLPIVSTGTWTSSGSTVTVTVATGHGFVSSDVLNTIIKVTAASGSLLTNSFVVTGYTSSTVFSITQTAIGATSGTLSYFIPQQCKVTVDGVEKTAATISASADFVDLSDGGTLKYDLLDQLQPRIDFAVVASGLSAGQPHTVELKFTRFYQFRLYGIELSQNSVVSASINPGRAFVNENLLKNQSSSSVSLPLVQSQHRGLISARYVGYDETLEDSTYELTDFDGNSDAPQGPVAAGANFIALIAGTAKLETYFRAGDIVKVGTFDTITSEKYEEVKVIGSFPVSGSVTFTSSFVGGTGSSNAQLYHLASTQIGSADPCREYALLSVADFGEGYTGSTISDFSTPLTSTLRNRKFSFEDGCIQLTAYQASYTISNRTPYLSLGVTSTLRFIFVGTRLDFVLGSCGSCAFTVSIDGSDPISYSVYGTAGSRITIFNNARFQSHELFVSITSGNLLISDFALFSPTFATDPQGCQLSVNSALARYITSQAVAGNVIPTGSLCVDPLTSGGRYTVGTGIGTGWAVSSVTSPFYVYAATSQIGSAFSYTFYGDAFEIGYLGHSACGTHTLYINDILASTANFSAVTRWGVDSSGNVAMLQAVSPATPTRKKFGISGLTLGFNKIELRCAGNEMNIINFYEAGVANNFTETLVQNGPRKFIAGGGTSLDTRKLRAAAENPTAPALVTSKNVYGITDGSASVAGTLGESVTTSPALSVTPAATTTFKTVTSITLSAGKYMVSGAVYLDKTGLTGTLVEVSISSSTDSAGSGIYYGKSRKAYSIGSPIPNGFFHTGSVLLVLEGSTVLYLTSALTYTGPLSATYTTASYLDAIRIG